MRQNISIYPQKELLSKTRDIPKDQINSATYSQIAAAMFDIMKQRGGIGLSANQVGLPLNMCVIALNSNDKKILLNPRIIKTSKKLEKSLEGCLSLPGCSATLERYKEVTVEYEDVTGETQTIEATGLLSKCLQHEIDHLKGLLIINRLSTYHREKVIKDLHKFKKTRNGKKL
jgi:peptide deformylase